MKLVRLLFDRRTHLRRFFPASVRTLSSPPRNDDDDIYEYLESRTNSGLIKDWSHPEFQVRHQMKTDDCYALAGTGVLSLVSAIESNYEPLSPQYVKDWLFYINNVHSSARLTSYNVLRMGVGKGIPYEKDYSPYTVKPLIFDEVVERLNELEEKEILLGYSLRQRVDGQLCHGEQNWQGLAKLLEFGPVAMRIENTHNLDGYTGGILMPEEVLYSPPTAYAPEPEYQTTISFTRKHVVIAVKFYLRDGRACVKFINSGGYQFGENGVGFVEVTNRIPLGVLNMFEKVSSVIVGGGKLDLGVDNVLKSSSKTFFSDGSLRPKVKNLRLTYKVTAGLVTRMRFTIKPTNLVHLGNAKSMFVNFDLAKKRYGICYLRYDDANPTVEENSVEELVEWMGWKPINVTYTSDYFQELHETAVGLIRRGHAYVDHQTPEEIEDFRKKKMNSPWRDRPIEESLKLFDDMKQGTIEEGKATLRLKQNMQSSNVFMQDSVAYHIKFTPHPRTGDKWCIFPSYDYAQCIADSIEMITHALTFESETTRESYYWLLDTLELHQPYVWEYSPLNMNNTVMSKRMINQLVTEKYVDSWDDPRLMTLAGLRRRGVTASSINSFVRDIGITRSDNGMTDCLEDHVKKELNKTAPRAMVVLNPLRVIITNMGCSVMDVDAKKWPEAPADDASSFYKVPFSRVVYIEQSDFRATDISGYNGLSPGKSVFLRYAFPIKCTEVIYGDNGSILEVRAEYDPLKEIKSEGVLHWVSESAAGADPLKVEVRLFDKLFNSENPAELEDWLGDLNPGSKLVVNDAYAVPWLKNATTGDRFQFEGLGYFVVDKDSSEKLVFNRIVEI